MVKLFIRKDDQVAVTAGRDKGKQGKVLSVNAKNMSLLVEGVNMVKRHVKPTQTNPQGGIVSKESKIHYSNVQLLHPTTQKPLRASLFKRGVKGELILKSEKAAPKSAAAKK